MVNGQTRCLVPQFGGLSITLENNGETLLTGPVVDQAALYGLLRQVRDVRMPLLSVSWVEPGIADVSDVEQYADAGSAELDASHRWSTYSRSGP
jgi:hypothetical protein